LGRRLPNGSRVVLRVTDGGPDARRYPTSFSPDVGYLNSCIRRAEGEGLVFLGEWHLHPGALSSPSAGDETTIRETMDYTGLEGFEALIVNIADDNSPKLFAYHYDSTRHRSLADVRIIDDREAMTLMPWFDTQEGRERLLVDSRAMKARFRSFQLFKKKDQVWWAGEYLGHSIQLTYPSDFPNSSISIDVVPQAAELPDEPKLNYAFLAAELAIQRIDVAGTRVASPPMPERRAQTPMKWYDSTEGQRELHKLDTYLRRTFNPVTTFKSPAGEIAFNCGVKDYHDVDLLISFPNDFPDHMPEVKGVIGRDTVNIPTFPAAKWTGAGSMERLVKDAMTRLQRENLPKKTKGRWRMFDRAEN